MLQNNRHLYFMTVSESLEKNSLDLAQLLRFLSFSRKVDCGKLSLPKKEFCKIKKKTKQNYSNNT